MRISVYRLWPLVFVSVLGFDSSPTAPGDDGPTASPGVTLNQGLESQVADLMNQRRAGNASCGGQAFGPAGALRVDSNLRAAARAHSIDMAERNYFSHTTPEGLTFDQRIRNSGYGGQPVAENIAVGRSSPSSVVAGWMTSAGHCQNIMRNSARDVGVGFANNYWTAKFGR